MRLPCSFDRCQDEAIAYNIQKVLLGQWQGHYLYRAWNSCASHVLYYQAFSGEQLHQKEKDNPFFHMFFLVKPEHCALARSLNIRWYSAENGGPGADIVRPYGNSDLIADIATIVNYRKLEEDEIYAAEEENHLLGLHQEMHIALQIFLDSGKFHSGIYKKPSITAPWEEVVFPGKEAELVFLKEKYDG